MKFWKYHALGNDYLVLDPGDFPGPLTPGMVQRICHRNFGVGSDGILWGPSDHAEADFGLRIFNPDGGQAEKSGNGLRIFARFLWDQQRVSEKPFSIHTPGGVVQAQVFESGRNIRVDMGQVRFHSQAIPVTGPAREVLQESVRVGDRDFEFSAATIGNPHCVVPLPEISAELARQYGPGLERHPLFPNRTNVQFLKVRDRANIQIEIWERGAGYTLASGSSSSAAAAVARRLGWCDDHITVHMPGGTLQIEVDADYFIRMTGPVTPICQGTLRQEMF